MDILNPEVGAVLQCDVGIDAVVDEDVASGALVTSGIFAGLSPVLSPVSDIEAELTDQGAQLHAIAAATGLAFRVVGFAVGIDGYYTTQPGKATPVDKTATSLGNQVFPTIGNPPEPVDRYEYASAYGRSFLCRLDVLEALDPIGEWGLFVEVLTDPLGDWVAAGGAVGDIVLYAVSHQPVNCKTQHHVYVNRFVITITGS